ncbi:hypothetical protein [Polluticoccus soli]|uniref:hypothetical protein n=1 Tax=Polluticoccus soli TaxID=3034150 RepID=UPI0023E1D97C|nr:hypothetical protein [Flavipsychrobacter sp. JY13-12]
MAEIVEVIHQINYEVNDAQLQNAVNVIHAQIRELNSLYNVLDRYHRQLANVRDTTAFNELSRKVDGATRQIEASLGKTKGILAQFGSGLLKGLGVETDLEGAVAKWLEPLNTHLESVKNRGNDTVTSLGGIAAKLTSFSGLAPLAIGMLSELADEFFSVSEETKRAREEQERRRMALDFVDKQYSGDAVMKKKAAIITEMDELSVLTLEEVLQLRDAGTVTAAAIIYSRKLPVVLENLIRAYGEQWFLNAGFEQIKTEIESEMDELVNVEEVVKTLLN